MTRGRRIALRIAITLAGLVLVVAITGIVIVQTQWFRDRVHDKIVSTVETATGGRAAMDSFSFDWHQLRAQIRNFTLRGLEEPGAAPLFHANLLQVDLKLLSPFRGFVDIAYLLVDTPQANVIVYADGHTNMPAPKIQPKNSDKTGLETIVDVAIGHFDLRNGSFAFGDARNNLDASGANFRAQLKYNAISPAYSGEIDISPLHVHRNGSAPLDVNIRLPLTLGKDRIEASNAQLTTAGSHITISGTMEHLVAPKTSVHMNAELALEELRRVAGLTMTLDLTHGPSILIADVTGSMDAESIRIQNAHVTLGQTSIEASGSLKEANGGGNAKFNAAVDLGGVGRLLRVAARPEGSVKLDGTARLDAQNNYYIDGNVQARQVAFHQGTTRIAGVSLDSKVTADAHRVALDNLRVGALGGTFAGGASLLESTLFQVEGRLQNLDLEQIPRAFMGRTLGYSGVISGPVQANGNIQDLSGVSGRVNLAIAPTASRKPAEVPVSGRLNAEYNGRADTVTLPPSYIALPHTRADLSGRLGQQIQVKVISQSLADLRPLADIPVVLGPTGTATLNATVTGKLSAPKIAGDIAVNDFSVQGRPFSRFSALLGVSPSGVVLNNAVVARGALSAQLSASLGLRDWKAMPTSPLRVDATVRNADVKDVLAIAGQASLPVTGAVTVDAHFAGTMGSPTGTVDAVAVNGFIEGEKFDTFTLQARMAEGTITVPTLSLVAGASRLDANAVFRHPANDFEQGSITGRVTANQVQLAQFQSLVKDRPGLQGTISLNADASANLRAGQFEIAAVNGNLTARGLAMEGKALGDLTATGNTAGSALHYNVSSNFAGSTIRIDGQTEVSGDHRTTANAAISNLPLDRVLALAGRRDLPVTGLFGATAQVSGTLADPHAAGSFTVANGSAYQEPFTRLQADVTYTNRSLDVPRLHLEDGPSFLDGSVSVVESATASGNSDVRFHVNTNQIQLARVRAIKQFNGTLDGVVQLTADGAAQLRKNASPLISAVNANLHATGISMNGQGLGDLTATAATRGNTVDFNLASNLAHSDVKSSGTVQLAGDYPVNARMTFSNVTYRGLRPLLTADAPLPLDASLEGEMTVSGPVTDITRLQGSLQLTKLDAQSVAPSGVGAQPRVNLDLKNSGNIVATLDHGIVTVGSFRLAGRDANLAVAGTVSLDASRSVRLRVDGNLNLEILEALSSSIYSSGSITLNAAIEGTTASPNVNGRLALQKASFNMLELPNGLSNATGSVTFTGTEAYVQNITGESGGGKVTLSGTVAYGGPQMQFRLQAAVNRVHIRYPDTVTTEVSANLALNGTSASSLVTGSVRIVDLSLHSGADVGNVLTSAATPPSAPTAPTGPLAGMRFDVRIQTTPGVQFRTSLTQNLQASANLTLLGTPQSPGMLGQVAITGGDVVFFGNQYTIDQGSMSFFDVSRINPILNVDLKTTVQGVDVSLSVSGPVDKMKLSYRSDPPLQFQQLVSLLASGKMPTTDPVRAARTPAPAAQNLQQTGASTLLGQAVANPVSGRLQRLFGVSKLSIDPQIIGTTNTAQATLTLQQQVTRDITFTYIQDVTQGNPEIVRVEWAINPRYSAIAQRDVNGELTVDLFYKKRFH